MENLNLVELKQDELREVEGGWIQVIVAALIIDTIINYDDAAAALQAGYSAARD